MVEKSNIEAVVEKYPWYSQGHLELFAKMCELGEEHKSAYLVKAAAFVHSRAKLFEIASTGYSKSYENKTEKVEDGSKGEDNFFQLEEYENEITTKVIVAGGDYFSRSEYEDIKLTKGDSIEKFIAQRPTIPKAGADVVYHTDISDDKEPMTLEDFSEATFYTETLAKIYFEQGFYKRAVDVYAKLILLYPEKSAYFAALAQEIKTNYNI